LPDLAPRAGAGGIQNSDVVSLDPGKQSCRRISN